MFTKKEKKPIGERYFTIIRETERYIELLMFGIYPYTIVTEKQRVCIMAFCFLVLRLNKLIYKKINAILE